MFIKKIDECLVHIIRKLNKCHLKLINQHNIKKWHFKYLIPEKDAEKIARSPQNRFPQFRVFILTLDNNGVTTGN